MKTSVRDESLAGLTVEAVVQRAAHPLAIFTKTGQLAILNEPFWRIHGLRSAEQAYRDLPRWLCSLEAEPGESDSLDQHPVQRALAGGSVADMEVRCRRRDTREWWVARYTASPSLDASGQVAFVVVSVQDVTVQRKLEQLLRDTEERLKSVSGELRETREDLQQFALTISHDLQTPLATISGFVDKLQLHYGQDLDEEGRQYLQVLASGSARMHELIDGLLAYSRAVQEPVGYCVCDSNAALNWALGDLEASIKSSGAAVSYGELPPVMASFTALTQVFRNLLSNAVKYCAPRPRIEVTAVEDGDSWTFCVADNGAGIAEHHHERVFGIFKRLHGHEIPGAGIGLALCRRIVESHGGRIWVDSRSGEGARFYFSLPKTVAARAAVGARS